MTIFLLGVSHHTSRTDLRGRLTVSDADLPRLLREFHALAPEVVVLSTCNRTEVYAAGAENATAALLDCLAGHSGVPVAELQAHCYMMAGEEAVNHLMSVAAGLDSVVLGEPQILGQVRMAWDAARAAGSTGATLNTLFRYTLQVGKDVRSRTVIARGATSIAHAAVEISRKELGTLQGRTVLVLGAGEAGRIAAMNLLSAGATRLLITNRTHARAESLAGNLGGVAVPFDQLSAALVQADTVVACSAAPEPLVTEELLRTIARERGRAPLVLMDIAVPRNVEPGARAVPGVRLFDMDDIQELCERNKHARAVAARRAGRDIREWVERFSRWQREREAVPLLSSLRARAEQVRVAELNKVRRELSDLTERERNAVEALSHGLLNSLLHDPVMWLKGGSTEEGRRWLGEMWSLAPGGEHGHDGDTS